MKIVLFGFHVNRVRSVIQRMPDMLAHMEKGEIMARPKKEKELARSHLIAFRLTDVEYDLVTRMAKEAGRRVWENREQPEPDRTVFPHGRYPFQSNAGRNT